MFILEVLFNIIRGGCSFVSVSMILEVVFSFLEINFQKRTQNSNFPKNSDLITGLDFNF